MKIDITLLYSCGEDVIARLYCPEPNYSADKNSDSYTEHAEDVQCESCDKTYLVNVMNSHSGASVSTSPACIHIKASDPYFDHDEIGDWLWDGDVPEYLRILNEHLDAASEILKINTVGKSQFSLNVMIYGHLVAATEGFLSSAFIKTTISNQRLIKKLVESDPNFANMKFSMTQIYEKRMQLDETVSKYLHDLIFHDLEKIKPMYKSVLGHEFGDISWLFKAVTKRHHCVHRAGYDKDGKAIPFNESEIETLIHKIRDLSKSVNETITQVKGIVPF
jgi:hypothetical protein